MKDLLHRLIDYLQAKFPPNRIAVLLTPFFSAAAGYVAAVIAERLPGVTLDETQLVAVFIAGATGAAAEVYKWLDGWQKHEQRSKPSPFWPTIGVVEDVSEEVSVPSKPPADEKRQQGFPPE